ncbi:hypothetical protein M5K25_018329 [Dendrobium thyrsiflorum]|uniref:Peptidase A1 domain-containing protein n=1 Tax=Dendrobium thyrsiflorum TaxID=117978 RepID=A0ABD0UHY9_DENTH
MRPNKRLLLFTFLTIFQLTSLTPPSSSNELSLRLQLTHIDAGLNLTVHELLRRAAARSKARIALLAHIRKREGQAPIFWGPKNKYAGEYLINFDVGTPPINLPFIVDTGSTLVWTQCNPCHNCMRQPVALFDPKNSSSFSKLSCSSKQCLALGPEYSSNCSANLDCHFESLYADGTETSGYIASEEVTFHYSSESPLSVSKFAIGCANVSSGSLANSSGIAGFGRSTESLVSQLNITRFSYCFIPFIPIKQTKPSHMLLGNAAFSSSKAQSTPLLPDNNFYYVSLKGITVGLKWFPLRPGFLWNKKGGSRGTIFDSGSFNTFLRPEVFKVVRKAFVSQINLTVTNEKLTAEYQLCFNTSMNPKKIPKLVLHFDGANMDLPRENYVVYDAKKKLLCVLIAEETDKSAPNIIGNFYQQNMNVLYDLKNQRLFFGPTQCDRL